MVSPLAFLGVAPDGTSGTPSELVAGSTDQDAVVTWDVPPGLFPKPQPAPAEHWCGGRGHPACTHCLHRPACTRSGHLPTLHTPLCTPSLRRVSGTSEPQTPAKLNPELCSGAGSPGQAASVRDTPARSTRLTTSQRQIITTQHTSSGSCPGGVPALRGADPRSPTFRTVTCAQLLPGTRRTLPAALPRSRSRGCPIQTLLVS